jgi:hypothetical protein
MGHRPSLSNISSQPRARRRKNESPAQIARWRAWSEVRLLGNRLDIQMSRLVEGVEAGICLQLTDCKCLKAAAVKVIEKRKPAEAGLGLQEAIRK